MSTSENTNRGRGRGGYSRGRGRGRGNFSQGGYRGNYHGRPFNKRPQNYRHKSDDGKRTKFEVSHRLKEVDIGVTEFMGSHEHFAGTIKERFSDFHVHEIGCDGEIAKLTSQAFPLDLDELDDLDSLKTKIPKEAAEKIESIANEESEVKSIEIEVTDMDKEERRIVHAIAKKIPSIISQTVDRDNKKYIVVSRDNKPSHSGPRFRRDNRVDWSRRPGLFCHFLLHKVNMDTMDALNQMAMYLRIKSNMFYYAGTKDRRARTTQWICLKRVDPRDILEAGKRVRGAYVGNFKYVKDSLRLGMLNGNHFTIALRNVTATDEEIETAMKSLCNNGFINYYGLQRFGSVASVPTHTIGKALLQGNWNEAIKLILTPRPGEQKDMSEAREIYEKTKDAAAALKRIHRHDKIEAKLLRGIVQSGDSNPQGALDLIPRNARTMYIHAYQSFVWNNMVSKRMREFGPKPVVGDLVYEKSDVKDDNDILDYPITNEDDESHVKQENEKKDETVEESKSEEEMKVDDEDVKKKEENGVEKMEVEIPSETVADDAKKSEDDTPLEKDRSLPAVKILTEEDLPNYTFADIIMPQPGWRVTYPTYAKPWFDEILEKDELTSDLAQKNKKYTLGGAYRKILQVPENLSWKIMHYKELHDDLILCDIDEFRGNEAPKDNPEGKFKAVILEMSLKPSTYATMALREILSHDTSAQTQAERSAAHYAQDAEENRKMDEDKSKSDDKEDESVTEAEAVPVSADDINITDEKPTEVKMETESIEPTVDGAENSDKK